MDRQEKRQEVEFLNDCFTKAQIALCADYRGLTVAQVTKLRRELTKVGARARVVKNTLARIAVQDVFKSAEQAELERFTKIFDGPSFVVFSEKDPVAPSKVLATFAKDNEKFSIKGAWFEGAFVDKSGVGQLATMPGKEELLGKLLNLLLAPATQLVRLMQAPGTQLVRVLDAQRAKLETK
jgi:large subunit ribosomal protein L10